jgi:hypothetical protein
VRGNGLLPNNCVISSRCTIYISNPWNAKLLSYYYTQILKDMTLFFLHSTPHLAIVIIVIDFINNKLTAYTHDQYLSLAIKVSLKLRNRKKTMNCYYSLTDLSKIYHIVIGIWLIFSFVSLSHFISNSFTLLS